MSIYVEILQCAMRRELFLLSPAFPGAPAVRRLYVTPEIRSLIYGPWDDRDFEERCGYLWGDFDAFTIGSWISVALADQSAYLDECAMKQLKPASLGVWEFRSTEPTPGIRVFGAFAATNWFVAFNWAFRNDLGDIGSEAWDNAIKTTQHGWRKLFPTYDPKTEGDLHDYISKRARRATS